MKSKDVCSRDNCTGCEACANACTKNAITMKPDWRGFMFPHIDNDKCIDCGLCHKTCPANEERTEFVFPESRVFIEGNKQYLLDASSGGAFGAMARHVIEQGGVVFGCCMDDEYHVNYISVDKIEDLQLLHGSKYVQSYVGNIYREVKAVLKSNRFALFCGCPCQVAGLKRYLKKEYGNLITMDLICHGVPSQPYFHDYVKDLLKREEKKGITTFRFRGNAKSCCDTQHRYSKKNIYVGYHNKDYFMTYFLWGKGYREGCYNCRYAGGGREGDFTIGDFWNNEKTKFPIDVSNGSSLVLLNTPKARSLETVFKKNGICIPLNGIEEAMGGDGGQLKHPSHYDLRCKLIYVMWKMFGLRGPKFLFWLDNLRMR